MFLYHSVWYQLMMWHKIWHLLLFSTCRPFTPTVANRDIFVPLIKKKNLWKIFGWNLFALVTLCFLHVLKFEKWGEDVSNKAEGVTHFIFGRSMGSFLFLNRYLFVYVSHARGRGALSLCCAVIGRNVCFLPLLAGLSPGCSYLTSQVISIGNTVQPPLLG